MHGNNRVGLHGGVGGDRRTREQGSEEGKLGELREDTAAQETEWRVGYARQGKLARPGPGRD
eukprot:10318688-Prorocentrum_lima.AAC.1